MELHDYIIDTPNRYITEIGSGCEWLDVHAYQVIKVPSIYTMNTPLDEVAAVGTEGIADIGKYIKKMFDWFVEKLKGFVQRLKTWLGKIIGFFGKLINKIVSAFKSKKSGGYIAQSEEIFKNKIKEIDAWLHKTKIEFIPHKLLLELKSIPDAAFNLINEIASRPEDSGSIASKFPTNKAMMEYLLDKANIHGDLRSYMTESSRDYIAPRTSIADTFKDLFNRSGLSQMLSWTLKDFDKVYSTMVKIFTEERNNIERMYQPIIDSMSEFAIRKSDPIMKKLIDYNIAHIEDIDERQELNTVVRNMFATVNAAVAYSSNLLFRNSATVIQTCNNIFNQFETRFGLINTNRINELMASWFGKVIKQVKPLGTLKREKIEYYSIGDIIDALESSAYQNSTEVSEIIDTLYAADNGPNAYTAHYGTTGTFIVATTELATKCPKNILEVLIAHEVGHLRKFHSTLKQTAQSKAFLSDAKPGDSRKTNIIYQIVGRHENTWLSYEIEADRRAAQIYGADKIANALKWIRDNYKDYISSEEGKLQLEKRLQYLETRGEKDVLK